MRNAHIELWRVGDVSCEWLSDWRCIRILSGGEILSDHLLASPTDALESARELRQRFASLSKRPVRRRPSPPAASPAADRPQLRA